MNNISVLTVSQLNYYIKSLLDGDSRLFNVFVSGEISNFTNHYKSGHFYFSIKDEKATIKAVMFSSFSQRLKFKLEDGMKVLVRGRVSVYEASGQYQLYVEDIQPDGIGALNLQFEQLKEKLSKEGLFDIEKKKPLPRFPKRVGVITSPTGAVIRDIQNVLSRRFPLANIILCPVLVQGTSAPKQIISAIKRFNKAKASDVIIIARGGGSIEDLWAFNDETLARTVFSSKIPIISAVGHETDFTICDFVADLRAPTPSAAAELAVPDSYELLYSLRETKAFLRKYIQSIIDDNKYNLDRMQKSKVFSLPINMIEEKRLNLDILCSRLRSSFEKKLSSESERFKEATAKLNALSPLSVLSRGYCMAFSERGNKEIIIKSVTEVEKKQKLKLKLFDGEIYCTVDKKESDNNEKDTNI